MNKAMIRNLTHDEFLHYMKWELISTDLCPRIAEEIISGTVQDYEDLKDENERLNDEVRDLEYERDRLEDKIDDLKKENDGLQEENKELEHKLEEKEEV